MFSFNLERGDVEALWFCLRNTYHRFSIVRLKTVPGIRNKPNQGGKTMKKILVLLMILALSLFGVSAAFAYDVKVDEDTYAKVGAKVQILIKDTDNTGGTSNETDLTLPNARIYFAGQVTNMVKFGLNFDFAAIGTAATGTAANASGRATDAQITLDFAKEFKVMTGIYRVAFSRIALQDSYQYILIDGPVVDRAVAPVAGTGGGGTALGTYRNAGVTAWGDLLDGKLRYNVGVWDDNYSVYASNHMMKTARVVYNFLDPEKGYTCAGCYLGKANVANVGVGYLTQDYDLDKTYTAMTIDGFYESDGLTLEAAYFSADEDSGATTGVKPTSWYVEGAYLIGDLQPAARYESYDDDGGTGDYTVATAGINYLFDGANAKVGVQYAKKDWDAAGTPSENTYALQLQVQF